MNAETYILFELAGATYAVRSREVLHIDLLEHITPVPNAGEAVDGVVFSRGQVIPALNLRVRFGFPRESPTPRTRLIFARSEQRTVALIVDSAREFRSLADDSIRPIEATLAGVNGTYVRGVASLANRLILLLDVAALIGGASASVPTAPAVLQPIA